MTILGELARALGRGSELVATGTVSGPTLVSGDFAIATGLANVRHFQVSMQVAEDTADRVQSVSAVESGGTLTVTVSDTIASGGAPTWIDAETADVSAAVFAWIAIGS